jgi:predicted Zn-dependent protease
MGAIYAARAGYDPRASISFWEKMMAQKQAADKAAAGSESKINAIFSTHPADQKRIADLKALMPTVLPTYEQNKGKYQSQD